MGPISQLGEATDTTNKLVAHISDNLQCVGWSNFLGFTTGPCSVNYALAAMILAAAEIQNPDYTAQTWHLYLTFLLLLIIQGLLTMNSTKFLGYMNIVGTVINLIALIIFVIWLPAASINTPKFNDNHTVWVNIQNGTEWPTGWAFIMGFLTVIWTMSGMNICISRLYIRE